MSTVFLFGLTGVGKSTICASVCHFLHEERGLVPASNPIENPAGAQLVVDWMKRLRRNEFPSVTAPGKWQRVDIGFEDRQTKRVVGLSFCEIAGEDAARLDPLHPEHARRPEWLETSLRSASRVLLVCSTRPKENDRYALQMFAEFLRYHQIRTPIALVLTAWDRVDTGQFETPVDFAKEHYSEVLKILAAMYDDGIDTTVTTFSIGDVEERDGAASRVVRMRPELGAKQIAEWVAGDIGRP